VIITRTTPYADIQQLAARDGVVQRMTAVLVKQSCQTGFDPRPSAFQAGHIPSWHKSCECYALWLVAADSGWLLLSPLLSVVSGHVVCTWFGSV
jgi:hypothetical protein